MRVVPLRKRWPLLIAILATLAAILTTVIPAWIEAASGTDPDGGDGLLEWLVTAVLAVIALVSYALTWRIYRRPHGPAPAAG